MGRRRRVDNPRSTAASTKTPRPLAAHDAPAAAGSTVDVVPVEAEDGRRNFSVLVIAIFVGYMAFAMGLYVWRGMPFITPDRWVLALFLGALVFGRGLVFLRDWIPFVMLIFGYELLRSFAGDVAYNNRTDHSNVQVDVLINADRALFGGEVPTLWLQKHLYVRGEVHWYDLLAVMMYFLHFVFPLVFAFVLWLSRKERFWQFSIAFLLMTYLAFVFFLFYPAAPPWLANDWKHISGVQFPYSQTFRELLPAGYENFNALTIWTRKSPNPVAAMPSLHASFPWLVLLFAVKFYGKWGLLVIPYNVALWFSVVYGAQHWVVDLLAGVAWATVCFVAVQYAWPMLMGGLKVPVPQPVRETAEAFGSFVAPPLVSLRASVREAKVRSLAWLMAPLHRFVPRLNGRAPTRAAAPPADD